MRKDHCIITNSLLIETISEAVCAAVLAVNELGIVISVSREGTCLLGKSREEMLGQPVFELFPDWEELRELFNTQQPIHLEASYKKNKYQLSLVPIIQNTYYKGALIVFRDNLQECKEILNDITEGLADGVYITDARGTGLYMNNADYQITGLTESQVIGRTIYEMISDGLVIGSSVVQVLKTQKPASVLQKTPNGKTVMVTGIPRFDGQGALRRVIASTRDITELIELKKQLEEERRLNDKYYSELMSMKKANKLQNTVAAYSKKMCAVVELAAQVAKTDSTVLITGESGVGKEVIARFIYRESYREKAQFLKINCAAIPEHLLESELFGYEDGAFTGAKKGGKKGLIESVDKGTLFLDEIGEMPLILQGKLLQVLQDKAFIKVGGTKAKEVDIRIIAATNRDLKVLVEQGKFREDLYYRLNVVPVYLPPIRERYEDILPLAHIFLMRFNQKYGAHKELSAEVQELLQGYSWPGNVRELENCIERLVVVTKEDIIRPEHLPLNITAKINKYHISIAGIIPLRQAQEEVERLLFLRAYDRYRNTYKVAEALGVSQPTVVRKVNKYKTIDAPVN